VSGPVDQGQTYRYRQTVKDIAGVPANAGTVTFTITLPDGTLANPAVVNTSTGVYDIAYTTVQVGLHQIRGSATGGVLGSEFDFWTDAFTAEEPARLLIGVDEMSSHLRAQGVLTSDSDREQLRWLCSVATDAVERDLGLALVQREVTETFDGGGYHLNLGTKPPRAINGGSITITDVDEAGSTITDYVLRKRGWRLCKGSSLSPTPWAYGYENITVTYVSGCVNPPEITRHIAMNVAQTMWQASQQAEHPFLDEVARRASLATLSTSVLPSLSGVEQNAYNALRSVNSA
jgi:hypothetical protein